jgi:hypothetical protein
MLFSAQILLTEGHSTVQSPDLDALDSLTAFCYNFALCQRFA